MSNLVLRCRMPEAAYKIRVNMLEKQATKCDISRWDVSEMMKNYWIAFCALELDRSFFLLTAKWFSQSWLVTNEGVLT